MSLQTLIAVLSEYINYHLVRTVCNLTIWIQQASAYVVCLDLRSSPQVGQPRVGGGAQAVDGAVGSGLEGMGGTVWPVLQRLQSETEKERFTVKSAQNVDDVDD